MLLPVVCGNRMSSGTFLQWRPFSDQRNRHPTLVYHPLLSLTAIQGCGFACDCFPARRLRVSSKKLEEQMQVSEHSSSWWSAVDIEDLETTQLHGAQLEATVDFPTFASLLRRCGEYKALFDGRCLHAYMCNRGYDRNTFLGNCLVQMYSNCGCFEDAIAAFGNISKPNLHSWNILISFYAQNDSLDDVRSVFERMSQRDVVSWNATISAYVQSGQGEEALDMFRRMQLERVEPDRITFICILDACADLAALKEGQEIHAAIVRTTCEQDTAVGNALVNMYGKCMSLVNAETVFSELNRRDVISWSAMISAYAENGLVKEAMELFCRMQLDGVNPDTITCICILDACSGSALLEQGHKIHAFIVSNGCESDLAVGTALITMYGKCGGLDNAEVVFRRMPQRDVVAWSAMISACGQSGHGKEALALFCWMQREGVEPNKVTFISVLDACAGLAGLEEGQSFHAAIIDRQLEYDSCVANALLKMYGKCGNLSSAKRVFYRMHQRNVDLWSAMIAACAQNGHGKDALHFFRQMQCEGVQPDNITFTCILAACSHTGCVDEGRHFFGCMQRDHGLSHGVEHYVCMIDLLGRAGLLSEAEDLIDNMPFEKVAGAWFSLHGSCRMHGDVERGARAANYCFNLDSMDSASHILLSNTNW